MSADVASLRTDMASAKSAVAEATDRMAQGANLARNALGLLGVAFGTREAIEWVKSSIDVADQANKTAQKIGISTEALTGYQYAAKLADVDNEKLQSSLVKLAKNMEAAAYSGGTQAQTFKLIGVETVDASGKLRSIDGVMLDVADRFAGMEDGAQKAALAQELFGKAGAELIPFLNQGRDGIEQLRAEAERLGVVISTDTARQAEEFNDNLARLKASTTGVANALAEEMLPKLSRITSAMAEAAQEGGILRAVLVGIGGAAVEAFSRTNYTEVENIRDEIRELNREIKLIDYYSYATGWRLIFDDAIDTQISERKRRVAELNGELEKLRNPPAQQDAGPKLTLPDMSGVRESMEAMVEATMAQLKVAEEAEKASKSQAEANQKTVETLQAEASAMFSGGESAELYKLRLNGATDAQIALAREATVTRDALREMAQYMDQNAQAIDRMAQKSSEDFFKTGPFKENTKQAEDDLAAPDNAREAMAQRDAEIQQQAERSQGALYQQQASFLKRMQLADQVSGKEKVGIYAGAFSSITAIGAQHSKTMFEANKAAGIAEATVSTYVAAAKALAELGPIAGPIAATAITAMGLAQVAAISSTTFVGGGGGTTPSLAGGGVVNGTATSTSTTSGTSSYETQQAPTGPTIVINGDIHSNDAELFLNRLKALISDGDHVLIDVNSRNGQLLKGE